MWSRYLALGDSVTAGIGDDVGDLKCRSWAEWLVDALERSMPGLEYRNVAVPGATTFDVLRVQVPEIEAFRPDLVSVTVGANDARVPEWTADGFREQYAAILAPAAEAGASLLAGTYADVEATVASVGGRIRDSWRLYFDRMHEVNDVIRNVSARFGAALIETESVGANDSRYLSRDLTQPNALAYRLIAEVALKALSSSGM